MRQISFQPKRPMWSARRWSSHSTKSDWHGTLTLLRKKRRKTIRTRLARENKMGGKSVLVRVGLLGRGGPWKFRNGGTETKTLTLNAIKSDSEYIQSMICTRGVIKSDFNQSTDPHKKHRITVFPLCFSLSFFFVWLWEMGCICCSSCSFVVPGGERLTMYMLNAMDPMCTSSCSVFFWQGIWRTFNV